MLTYGVHELESGEVIPYMGGSIKVENNEIIATRMNGDISAPFKIDEEKKAKKWASRIWDINPSKNDDGTYPAFHDKGSIGGLIKGFFGYNGDPSLIEFITWIVSMIGLNFLYQKIGRRKVNGDSK